MLTMVQRVVGLDRTSLSFFTGSPCSIEVAEVIPTGRPVLALTDLSIARPRMPVFHTSSNDWLEFQTRLDQAGCSLTVFVPYPPRRWPRCLHRRLHLVQWDRVTGPSNIKRLAPSSAIV